MYTYYTYVRVSIYRISRFRDEKEWVHTTEDEFTGIATVDAKSTQVWSTQGIEETKTRKRRSGSHRQEQCKSLKERSREGVTGKSAGENRKQPRRNSTTATKTMNERENLVRESRDDAKWGSNSPSEKSSSFQLQPVFGLIVGIEEFIIVICVNLTVTFDEFGNVSIRDWFN